jgi:hypothetical protein
MAHVTVTCRAYAAKIFAALKRARIHINASKRTRSATHGIEWLAHCGYLGAVAIEAHGAYGRFAAILLAAVIVGAILNGGTEA